MFGFCPTARSASKSWKTIGCKYAVDGLIPRWWGCRARISQAFLPSFPADGAIELPAETLRTAIGKTAFAISQEESRYTINGALLLVQADALTMVATDGHRLAHFRTKTTDVPVANEIRVLIPKKALTEVASLLSTTDTSKIEFAKDESTLYFRIG